jgi:hypothetical protein
MWQKLNRIDTIELAKARVQLQNAIQLVSAGPRSYLNSKISNNELLLWNQRKNRLESLPFGSVEKVCLALDIEQFVLSIYGNGDHIEHLVLSGITYPMAFGWLKVKLETFSLNADVYNDKTSYTIEHPMGIDDALEVTNQKVFADIVVYFANSYMLLMKLNESLGLHGKIAIDPASLDMVLSPEDSKSTLKLGFSPGSIDYPEPHYYIQLLESNTDIEADATDVIGIWNHKNWKGLVYAESEYLNLDPEIEYSRISDFFNKNFWRLTKHKDA